MSVGLVVPGESDKSVLEILLAASGASVARYAVAKGDDRVSAEAEKYVRQLSRQRCRRAVVLRDCECTDPEQVAAPLRAKSYAIPTAVCVAKHALEGWLLADEEAVAQAVGAVVNVPPSPEAECRPKDVLRDLFRRHLKRSYVETVDGPRIARRVDVSQLTNRCPSFRYLVESIRGGSPGEGGSAPSRSRGGRSPRGRKGGGSGGRPGRPRT